MKTIITALNLLCIMLNCMPNSATAQEKSDSTAKHKHSMSVEIGNHGVFIGTDSMRAARKKRTLHTKIHFDFGFNNVVDNTDYSQNPQGLVNRQLTPKDLELNTGKSINFNFWPLWFSQDVIKKNVQIESGIGFQFFNYRYDSKVKHVNLNSSNSQFPGAENYFEEITDPAKLQGKPKNKFGVSYISIPLMIRFNTTDRPHKAGLTFAAGVIGSYKLKSWTKFYGEKESGNYDVRNWMTQITAEIGVPGIIKFYGTYALQPMYNNSYIIHTPFAIGIRL